MAVIWVCCIIDWRLLGATDGDALGFSILFFGILMPICSLVLSVWYGYRVQNVLKWLIVIACGFAGVMIVAVSTGDFDLWSNKELGLMSLVPAAVGMLIGSVARNLFHK
jgi:putative Mn2+ efflux pump MntP